MKSSYFKSSKMIMFNSDREEKETESNLDFPLTFSDNTPEHSHNSKSRPRILKIK